MFKLEIRYFSKHESSYHATIKVIDHDVNLSGRVLPKIDSISSLQLDKLDSIRTTNEHHNFNTLRLWMKTYLEKVKQIIKTHREDISLWENTKLNPNNDIEIVEL
jgi:hypothetical protein